MHGSESLHFLKWYTHDRDCALLWIPLSLSSTAGTDYNDSVVTMVTFVSGVTSVSYPVQIVDDKVRGIYSLIVETHTHTIL